MLLVTNEKHRRNGRKKKLSTAQKSMKLCIEHKADMSLVQRQYSCYEANWIR